MEIWKAAVLGIVQGLTEFLPISSSGHLILTERLLHAETGGADLFLGIMLHAGTLISVLSVYFSRLKQMVSENRKMLLYLVAATVPGAVVGLVFGDAADRLFFSGDWLWLFFFITAVLLWCCNQKTKQTELNKELNWKRAVSIGTAQALAIIPGLSRSGTTISAGIFLGLNKERSADFSLLMSIPIIAGAIFSEVIKVFRNSVGIEMISWQSLLVGMICSMIFGFIGVKAMLKTVKKRNFIGYSVYLTLLSVGLLVSKIFI